MEPRNYESGASASPPTAPEVPSVGYPTGGNPSTGTPATKFGDYWFYQISESLRNIVIEAGLTPDSADLTQLVQSIKLIGLPIKSHLFSTNGYIVFDGGDNPDFVLQWAQSSVSASEGVKTVNFPMSFVNACLCAIPIPENAASATSGGTYVELVSKAIGSVSVMLQDPTNTGITTSGITVLAIGY